MSLTIENRIVNLIAERISDHMIAGALAFVPEGSMDADTLINRIALSGSFTGPIPRKFELEITALGTVAILETPLWADLGPHAQYSQSISYTSGVAFDLTDTGVDIALTGAEVGDKWLVRCGTASTSVPAVYENYFQFESMPFPAITVVWLGGSHIPEVQGYLDVTGTLTCYLSVSATQFESGEAREILGDLRNCLNRDSHLWDGSVCLANDCLTNSDELFDRSENGSVIFRLDSTIKYRSKLKDARSL